MKGSRRASTHGVKDRGERDEDLVLFRDLHNRNKEHIVSLLQPVSDEIEPNVLPDRNPGNYELFRIPSARKSSGFEFLTENGKHDTDWLKTPPATPLFPSLEMEATGPQLVMQKQIPISLQQPLSRFANSDSPNPKTTNGAPKSPNQHPKPKPPIRPITPSQRSTTHQTKKTNIRSSTTPRRAINNTPNKFTNPERQRQLNYLASNLSKSVSVPVIVAVDPTAKSTKPRSRAVSPLVRSAIPAQIPGFSNETPPNLITDNQRSISATRGRPGKPEPPRKQSCSPSITRGRKVESNYNVKHDTSITQGSNINIINNNLKEYQRNNTQVVGSKMVDKMMNARKLAAGSESAVKERSTYSKPKTGEGSGSLGFASARMFSHKNSPDIAKANLSTNIRYVFWRAKQNLIRLPISIATFLLHGVCNPKGSLGLRLSLVIMYRTAALRLRSLKGRVGNLGTTRYATSSAVASRPSSGGLFSWLTGEQSSTLPPLEIPLSGVNLPPPLPDHVVPGKTKITTLPNGVKIASETSPNPVASIGIYVDSGSMYESPMSSGASHLLERMAFKSTTNRSHLRIVREVEAIGGNIGASASREQMGYTFDALKTYVPEMVELLVDSVRNPVFLDWEVKEELRKVKAEIGELSKNPQALLLEAIHSAGYEGALANPLLVSETALNRLDATVLGDFVTENYTAPRMVLAACGVEHEELLSMAEPLLSDLPSVPRPQEPKSVYVGGDYRFQADEGSTHVALAFEVPGGWHQEKQAVLLTVLQMLMGGGGSFSAGGPGKGMHSRLYLRVLNEHQQIQSFSAFNSIFNHSGLFGIYASTGPDFASQAVDLAVQEIFALTLPGQVTQVQLNRAKESTKTAVLMNLESRMIASEDIGRQVLTYGERKPVEHFLNTVDKITLEDIISVAEKIVSSPLTMASYGDVRNVPSYESVSRELRAK
ncbi:hypothetical protein FNV43_RR06763 [Rhamnella rubrinervis]|uniref:Complex III subunit II n=1 Tax=Rhamnella rubrinervis TaxID=2594499 RepID=A0A8K0HF68_9ROSA|nr:hypothetical protein FNV43_RR06763 [Rhamnella rubrinervis]